MSVFAPHQFAWAKGVGFGPSSNSFSVHCKLTPVLSETEPYFIGTKSTHTGAGIFSVAPVGVSLPVFASTRNSTILSLF